MTPYCVFDGRKHPMKLKTHEERADARAKAKEKLNSFYERGKDASTELVENDCIMCMKYVKPMATPDKKIISIFFT